MTVPTPTAGPIDPERTILRLHPHQSLEFECIKKGSPFRRVVAIGGIRSGKSLVIAMWLLDRGKWDASQMHAMAGNTDGQITTILQDVLPWVEAAGVTALFDKQPSPEWWASWRVRGIKVPPRRRSYRGLMVLSSGLHVQLVSMGNRAYKSIKGARYGSVVIEEVAAGATEEGVRYMAERNNCNIGPARCAERHHHVTILHSNPPDDDGSWVYDWLARLEKAAATKAGIARAADEDSFPALLRGVGDTILIPSRTIDNAANLPGDFIDDMASSIDSDTAARLLDGVLTRSRKGRVYSAFSHQNQIDTIPYDPHRSLYVALDFNKNPAIALFAHQLNPGEYPAEHERPGVTHIGVFGEVFHVGGADVTTLCSMLLAGQAGSDGSLPDNFGGLLGHGTRITFYGDATSNFETMAPKEWPIVDEVMRREIPDRYARATDTKRNPLVPLGVHAVNAKLRSSTGVTSLWIHPRCKHLIEDLLTNSWHRTDPSKIYKPGARGGQTGWMTTHCADALRYLVSTLFPLGREATRATVTDTIRGIDNMSRPGFFKVPAY